MLSFAARIAVVALVLAVGTSLGGGAAAADSAAPAAAPPAPAAAPAPADGDVETHVALGRRLSELGRYQNAVEEFRRAYELRAEPRLLYEIAETYRLLGAADQARFYYERYLASAPFGSDRAEVEAKVAALPGSHKAPHARPRMIPEEALAASTTPPPRPAPRPWRRWWFWTAIGLVAAAGATAFALSRQSSTEVPPTALGDQKFFR